MSNWGTMVQAILANAGGGRASDTDQVKRAIIDAIAHEEAQQYHFTESSFVFPTVAGQPSYGEGAGFPLNVSEILSEYLFVDPLQNADNRRPISKVSVAKIETLRAGVAYTSEPEVWSYFARAIELYPTPDAVHNVRGRVTSNPGTPTYRYDAGAWKFYKPNAAILPANELTDAYPTLPDTNAWFTSSLAFRVIRLYAEYLLYSGTWHAVKGADQRALQRYTEFRAALEDKASKLSRPSRVEPFDLEDA